MTSSPADLQDQRPRCTYPVPIFTVEGGRTPCGLVEAQHGGGMDAPVHVFTTDTNGAPAPEEETELEPLPETPGPLPADGTVHELDAQDDGLPFVSVSYSRGDGIVVSTQWSAVTGEPTVESLLLVAAGGIRAMQAAAADDAATGAPGTTAGPAGTEHVVPECGEVTPNGDGRCEGLPGHANKHVAWPGGAYERQAVRW